MEGKAIIGSLPKGISDIIEAIELRGEAAYITGGSLRDLLLGKKPADWDLTTSMVPSKVMELFPESDDLGAKYGIVRVLCKEEGIHVEIGTLRKDGHYTDYRRPDTVEFTSDVAIDLKRRDFTVNALACTSGGEIIDPLGGIKDIKNRLIRVIGDPRERFEEDPLRILRGIRIAAQIDFDIEMKTFEAMTGTSHLLEEISIQRRREEFEKILMADNAGKGLRMCVACDTLRWALGHYPLRTRGDNGDINVLIQNIDLAKKRLDIRMALLLTCFSQKEALTIIEELKYDNRTAKNLKAAQLALTDLFFASDKYSLKRFIYTYGRDVYDFLNDVSKSHRDVYGSSPSRIESRYYILKEIEENKEPIFVRDLVIDGEDLLKEGIGEGAQIGEILKGLAELTHRYPGLNTRDKLLKEAKKLKKPWRAKLKSIHWLR
ncbi:MAG: CCA tRNA nucleotidyltransferase [Anaerovoracaceae bacterium]|jgi:tRNA nucleotidyltransferase (CCA-adding enzyme)